jgi:hypothetical protein
MSKVGRHGDQAQGIGVHLTDLLPLYTEATTFQIQQISSVRDHALTAGLMFTQWKSLRGQVQTCR